MTRLKILVCAFLWTAVDARGEDSAESTEALRTRLAAAWKAQPRVQQALDWTKVGPSQDVHPSFSEIYGHGERWGVHFQTEDFESLLATDGITWQAEVDGAVQLSGEGAQTINEFHKPYDDARRSLASSWKVEIPVATFVPVLQVRLEETGSTPKAVCKLWISVSDTSAGWLDADYWEGKTATVLPNGLVELKSHRVTAQLRTSDGAVVEWTGMGDTAIVYRAKETRPRWDAPRWEKEIDRLCAGALPESTGVRLTKDLDRPLRALLYDVLHARKDALATQATVNEALVGILSALEREFPSNLPSAEARAYVKKRGDRLVELAEWAGAKTGHDPIRSRVFGQLLQETWTTACEGMLAEQGK